MSKRKFQPLPLLASSACLIDTHCHLDMDTYEQDFDEVIQRAESSGVKTIITIGIDVESSKRAVSLAKAYPMLHATVGIHPHDTVDFTDSDIETLSSLISNNRDSIVGYGEIGLDYVKNYAPRQTQIEAFAAQLELAKAHGLPVVIHDREAHEDTLQLLMEHGPLPDGGVMHCFSGDMRLADKVLALGMHISIPGVVTFKNAPELHEVAAQVPLERLLVETDGPFLTPEPYRGKRNEPTYVLYTADRVAKLRGISLEELATATTSNARELFRLPTDKQ